MHQPIERIVRVGPNLRQRLGTGQIAVGVIAKEPGVGAAKRQIGEASLQVVLAHFVDAVAVRLAGQEAIGAVVAVGDEGLEGGVHRVRRVDLG